MRRNRYTAMGNPYDNRKLSFFFERALTGTVGAQCATYQAEFAPGQAWAEPW